jgi:hypothetical protein
MKRNFFVALAALIGLAAPIRAAEITGQYLEARTCDVWTGPCFANSETSLAGKHAVMAWKIDKGSLDGVALDDLSVVAIIATSDTLGLEQTGPSKAVLIVDERASEAQSKALVRLAQKQAGKLLDKILRVQKAKVELDVATCKEGGCASLKAGQAHVQTRCLDVQHDKVCGNESAFYPPLCKDVKAQPAVAVKHGYDGKDFNETWTESDRRGAYLGSFEIR